MKKTPKVNEEKAQRARIAVKLLARLAKMPNAEIAYRCGVSERTVARWRAGAAPRRLPFAKLQALAHTYRADGK